MITINITIRDVHLENCIVETLTLLK